jgi:hypothetical protein
MVTITSPCTQLASDVSVDERLTVCDATPPVSASAAKAVPSMEYVGETINAAENIAITALRENNFHIKKSPFPQKVLRLLINIGTIITVICDGIASPKKSTEWGNTS